VHRQTIARVVEPAEDSEEAADAIEGEPVYGERVDEAPNDETPDSKKSDG
jgi:preprotein translocase subunit YajC